MNGSNRLRFGRDEALALLQRLRKDENTVLATETCRLYFVDVDVLGSYIDGRHSDIHSGWSNLFSLTSRLTRSSGVSVGEDAYRLSDAISRAVTGFLFGHFRHGRTLQRGRFWMTPEHSRELDNMVSAVLAEQTPALGKWQQSLFERYLELASDVGSSPQAIAGTLQGVFDLLRANASPGKVARTYDVRRRFVSVLTQLPVFPPSDIGRAFLVRSDLPAFEKAVRGHARDVLEAMLVRLREAQRSTHYWPAIEALCRLAFDFYADGRGDVPFAVERFGMTAPHS